MRRALRRMRSVPIRQLRLAPPRGHVRPLRRAPAPRAPLPRHAYAWLQHPAGTTSWLRSLGKESFQYLLVCTTLGSASMVVTAKILEAVGVSAYLGAAPLVQDRGILAAAASIVTVEARHQTFLRTVSGDSPIPQAFDVAISARQIFTLATQFITSSPPEANLNIQALPALVLTYAGSVGRGSILSVVEPSITADGQAFCAFTSTSIRCRFCKSLHCSLRFDR